MVYVTKQRLAQGQEVKMKQENEGEIVVTPKMVKAGLDELHEQEPLFPDWSLVLEYVYRAMAYAAESQVTSSAASSSIPSK